MTVLAATVELGMHPATALLLIGGLATAVFVAGLHLLFSFLLPCLVLDMLPVWMWGVLQLCIYLGMKSWRVAVDQQAMLFGYLFHIAAALISGYIFLSCP